jgi:hypothetical protein
VQFKKLVCTAAIVLFASAAVLLADYRIRSASVYGGNDPNAGWVGIGMEASMDADFAWAGTPGISGPTYIKAEVSGLWNPSCAYGFRDGDACADNAHMGAAGWDSSAAAQYNIVPLGCYTGIYIGYVDGNQVAWGTRDRCFDNPPSGGGGGDYCAQGVEGYFYDESGNCIFYESSSPIIIPLGKDRSYRLSRAAVMFDINGDGQKDYIYWTREDSQDAFLAVDRDGDGRITSGKELFGDATLPGVRNGFAALRQLAGVDSGAVDANHGGALFSRLLLWTDANHDGESQPEELQPASAVLEAIGLGYTNEQRRDGDGNLFQYKGWARFVDPTFSPNGIVWGNAAVQRLERQHAREINIYDVVFSGPGLSAK